MFSAHFADERVRMAFPGAKPPASSSAGDEGSDSRGLSKMLTTIKKKCEYTKENWCDHLVEFFIRSGTAPNMLVSEPFRKLISFVNMQAGLDIPSAPTLAVKRSAVFLKKRAELQARIARVPYRMTVVVDGWSSRKFYGFFGAFFLYLNPRVRY